MQKIKQLSLSEIQKIAAGQVVERPVDVLKELIENAIDAQATIITVYIEQAGHQLIRVVDNGSGMSSADALMCFERHATSKISSFDQLQQLATFGFRGEALYSIGAVSKITLVTKEAESTSGTRVLFNEGLVIKTEEVFCNPGTDIAVQELFFNVPVRKKFLKKPETEWRLLVQLFQTFCFAYPAIHFQLFSEGKLVSNCPSVHSIANRVTQLWDHTPPDALIAIPLTQQHGLTLQGIISGQHYFRYNRAHIFFFINNRWIKNYSLSHALLKGYLNVLPQGRYPVGIILLSLPSDQFDVNIHPRKEEVAFVQPKRIEDAITNTVKTCLQERIIPTKEKPTFQPFIQEEITAMPSLSPLPYQKEPFFFATMPEKESFDQTQKPIADNHISNRSSVFDAQKQMEQPIITGQESLGAEQYNVIGVYKKTYIMLDTDEGLVFVDQHAAHERILFEQFAQRFDNLSSVNLLFPETISLPADEIQLLMDNSIIVYEYGIRFEQSGPQQIIVTAVPVHLKSISWRDFIREIIDILIEYATLERDQFLMLVNKKLQAQMACKAAVKAGDILTDQQINQLLIDLYKTQNRFTCPHGRPTTWLVTDYELEKKFKRKI